ncbi:MAG TPA: hypothetical protein VJS89_07315 [Gammaproteobacteria bacterium]|nr:hypothetical protein [Gammaproteobacteria bacterium]
MIPNIINTLVGLALACATVLYPEWIERQYLPMLVFAVIILVMAVWARRSDPDRWFSTVNIVMAVLLAILALLPLPTLPNLAFWGGFWIGIIVPVVALWAVLYRPESQAAAD